MPSARFAELLEHLAAHEVDFVVVDMTAGILHGAPVTTVDVDLAALPALRATLDERNRRS